MADFSETSVSRSAKRVYTAAIADIDSFEAVISAFKADTTMNLNTRNVSSATYKVKVEYKDAAGDDAGYILAYATGKDTLNETATLLQGNEMTETMAGVGGTAALDADSYHWLVKFSCIKTVNIDGTDYQDSFTVSIGREYMLISGFAYDSTLTALETWADSQDALA